MQRAGSPARVVAVAAYMKNRLALVNGLCDLDCAYGKNSGFHASKIAEEIERVDKAVAGLLAQENAQGDSQPPDEKL